MNEKFEDIGEYYNLIKEIEEAKNKMNQLFINETGYNCDNIDKYLEDYNKTYESLDFWVKGCYEAYRRGCKEIERLRNIKITIDKTKKPVV